ncbi:Retrovirus-related Pol polyprotein from transposon 17.6 [Trichinella sp. T9]|nr:Retrovirus-related Pol polyprotein from transposon 17.6 [Trichinella sp. T9]
MLRQDVVEPSSSPWASPIVLVRKKDGSCRFCVDYRQLNNLTRKDAHPLPRIDDTLDALAGAQWFSTLDLASGYWQVEVEPQDREKTAFTTPLGLYQFKVMPFGLCNAPATFQRLMETVLRGLVGSDCLVYLDDVIVFGKTAEEHTARLREVFRRLREVGLKIKPEKCRLMKRRVAYLGHIISEKGIATDPSKTSAVREWPTPTCVSELRQFLGLASYYRKFVNGFANVAAPLHRLLEKGAEWDWSKACQSAFDTLKYHLTSAPVLAYPDFHRQFIVDVDASGDGLGADAHPLPRIDDTLDALAGAQWFSTLDLASGYWQVEVEPQDREKTAFTTPLGLYQFKVMPFGLCNAPATFQRLMETVLRGLVGSDCLVYLDDVIVFGKTAEEHTARLREVFRRLREKKGSLRTQAKPLPCGSGRHRLVCQSCGSSWGWRRTTASSSTALRMSPPRYTGCWKKRPSGQNGQMVNWSKACKSAFDELKYHLTSAPVLAYPDFHRQFIVDVDTSRDGLGAVLSQREGKAERVVAYASRTLTKSQRRYCATQSEMLSLFLVRRDHGCLRWLTTFKEPEGQVARWLESLAELNYEVKHRAPARLHGNADALSRTCCTQCGRLSFKDQLLAAQQANPEIQLLRQ